MDKRNTPFLQSLIRATHVLQQYFEGELSNEQQESVEAQLSSLGKKMDKKKNGLSGEQLDKSHQRIKRQVFARLQLEEPAAPRRTLPVAMRRYAAIAAVMAVLVVSGYFMFSPRVRQWSEQQASAAQPALFVETGNGKTQEVTLPDGTRLFVNRQTLIHYIPQDFNKRKREIWLEGEAFFEVTHNPHKPFIIHSGEVQTTVRGTSFNIQAYPQIGEISVSVRDGKVQVNTSSQPEEMLIANQRMVYDVERNTQTLHSGNWEEDAAWREGRLVLKDANLRELKLRVQQLYGVQMEVEGNFLDDARFGVSFQKGTELTDVLNTIAQLYNVRYTTTPEGNYALVKR